MMVNTVVRCEASTALASHARRFPEFHCAQSAGEPWKKRGADGPRGFKAEAKLVPSVSQVNLRLDM